MNTEEFKRKLTAILSADVEGYSRLMRDDEEATIRTLTTYRTAMTGLIQQYRGRVVDSPGDNILAEFTSVVDAVNCAVEMQRELAERNAELPESRRMEFRIGVNVGDVVEEGERIYGDGVNIAARMEGLAEGAGICISGTAYDQVKHKLGLEYEYLGEQEVKNIAERVPAYRVLSFPGAAAHRVVKAKRAVGKIWRNVVLVIAAVLVVGAAVALWHFYFRPPPVEVASVERMAFPLPDKPSIAVLPFTNMGRDPEQEYFCDGITDQIITSLSIIPRLFVVARNSTFAYKGKAVKVQKVAEELGVRYVLEGSVQRSEERIRILVQLIDATTGHHLWSERYDRDLKDLFALQDEIAMQIMTALQVKLTEGEYARVLAGGTSNLQAMESFWRAEERFFRFSKEDNAEARRWVEKAIELDPNFSGAWALKGYTHMTDVVFGFSKSPVQSIKRAEECAQKAIALDDSNAKAYALLGRLRGIQRKFDQAIEYGEKAVALNPNDPHMLLVYSITMHFNGRFEESIALIKKAMRLSPYYPAFYLQFLAPSYVLTERYEEAIATSKLLLDRSRKGEFNPLLAHLYLAEAYVGFGHEEEARAHAEEVLKINPNFSLKSFRLLYAYRDPIHSERRIAALSRAGLPKKPPLPLPDKPSIAVLPFVNMSGDPEQDYFSDGMTEEIITALCKTPKLFVIARNSTFTYKGKSVWIPTVGKELGVKYVLDGSVRMAGDKVRVTAQLIDAQTNNHIWAERYDRDLKDIFAIQDDITKNIITSIQVKLILGEQGTLSAEGTKNLDAYLYYLQAWDHLWQFNKEDNMKARQLAEKSIALDPEYDKGYSVLAHVEIIDVWLGASKSPKEALMRCIELAKKSIAISDSPLPHRTLAGAYLLLRKHSAAIEEAKKAIEMAPNYADAYMALGLVYMQSDMGEEAVPVLQKAIRLNPYPPSAYYNILAWSYYLLGKYDEAIAEGKRAISVNPKDFLAHLGLICAYLSMGREGEARAHAVEVLRIDPNFSVDKAERTTPLKNKDKLKRIMEQYRMAGLPD